MERLESQFAIIAAAKRDEIIALIINPLPEEDPTRAEVAPGCLLKHGDDVTVSGETCRVLCPGGGTGWFYGLQVFGVGFNVGQWEAQYVTDRAPADPNETPMPILPEPQEPEPDPEPVFPTPGQIDDEQKADAQDEP